MGSTELSNTFEWPVYVVVTSVLILSAGVGVFYGWFGSKQNSNEEFLMGNRQMEPFPVALSLLCSYYTSWNTGRDILLWDAVLYACICIYSVDYDLNMALCPSLL